MGSAGEQLQTLIHPAPHRCGGSSTWCQRSRGTGSRHRGSGTWPGRDTLSSSCSFVNFRLDGFSRTCVGVQDWSKVWVARSNLP